MADQPPIIPPGQTLPPMLTEAERTRQTVKADDNPKGQAKHRGRFAVLNAFVDCSLAGLTRAELATWLVLYRDTRDGTARTSASNIARRIGATRRTVMAALKGLRKRRMLTVVFRGSLNRGASIYRVHPLPGEP